MALSTNKKILVISTMYPSGKHPSFGIFVKNQVELLRKKGFNVDVIAIKNPKMGKANVIKKYSQLFINVVSVLLSKGRSYDIVHAHYIFPSGWLALLFKQLCNAKIVVTVHGGDIDKMARIHPLIYQKTKQTLSKADEVIVVGEELRDKVRTEFGIPNHKITLLNMGVNRMIFSPISKKVAKKELGLPIDEKIILYVGNLIYQKGIAELVTAFQEIQVSDRISLHLIGAKKEPEFLADLQKEIRDQQMEKVIFHQAKDQKEIARWLSAADVFVLPSHIEGFGLTALEAMACHTPVIGSKVGGLAYLLDGKAGMAVKPKSPNDLKIALMKVLKDQKLREELVNNGMKKVQKYDQQRLIKSLISIYGR